MGSMDSHPKKVLSKRLKTLMAERGVNRKKIETKTGVSARTVGYMLEAGENSNPTLENLMLVAEYFGISVWELLFDPEVDTKKLMERGLKGGRIFADAAREEEPRKDRPHRE
jgi:transcriptional regulator with XRE-family HTH domain